MPSTKLPNLELFSEGHHLYEIKGMGTPSIDNFSKQETVDDLFSS